MVLGGGGGLMSEKPLYGETAEQSRCRFQTQPGRETTLWDSDRKSVRFRVSRTRKIDVRLPEKVNSNSHGARPVHLIITMIKWIRASRLSIQNSLSYLEETSLPVRAEFSPPRKNPL